MNIDVLPGKYIIAISGGVDSMVLLDLLVVHKEIELIVAHFDHGIRADSSEDKKLVEQVAARHNLIFEYEVGSLGENASEAVARDVRYEFLHNLRQKYGAKAIITAHHQDDQIETAILNLIRGASRLGFSSLQSRELVIRPLLSYSKQEIINYAKSKNIIWREDSTNSDLRYRRNYVRSKIVSIMNVYDRQKWINLIAENDKINKQINELNDILINTNSTYKELQRQWFILLPHKVAAEIMASWLRQGGVTELSGKMIERLIIEAKTKSTNSIIDINKDKVMAVKSNSLAILPRER